MINVMHLLIEEYRDFRRLYLTWNAASWHSSKKFLAEVKKVNSQQFKKYNDRRV